jgi:hypothetical protein
MTSNELRKLACDNRYVLDDAASEIDRLTAENERLKAALEHCTQNAGLDSCAELSLETHHLRQRVAELERDAKRYRWLVSNFSPAIPDTLGRHIIYIPPLLSEHGEIDAAIDFAMEST